MSGVGLTGKEMALLRKLGSCAGDFADITGDGPSRSADLAEVCDKLHQLQATVMAQAAARAHPAELRLLGEIINDKEADPMTAPTPIYTEDPATRLASLEAALDIAEGMLAAAAERAEEHCDEYSRGRASAMRDALYRLRRARR